MSDPKHKIDENDLIPVDEAGSLLLNPTLHGKLIDIQQNLQVQKLKNNDFAGFMYRSIEDIETAVKPFLLKHKLTLIFNNKMIEVGGRVYVESTAQLSDGISERTATAYAQEAPEPKKKTDHAQLTGGVSSYADKYAAQKLFLIDDGKSDPDNAHVPDATVDGIAALTKAKSKLYSAFKKLDITDSQDMMTRIEQIIGKDSVDTLDEASKILKALEDEASLKDEMESKKS